MHKSAIQPDIFLSEIHYLRNTIVYFNSLVHIHVISVVVRANIDSSTYECNNSGQSLNYEFQAMIYFCVFLQPHFVRRLSFYIDLQDVTTVFY